MGNETEHQNSILIWNALFNALDIGKNSSVVDLCPGDDPKVELALIQYGFRGKLIAVDASEECLARLREQLNQIIGCNLTTIAGKLQDIQLPQHDHITGNHAIDDLMSFEFCRRHAEDYDRLPQDVEYSRRIWDRIAASPAGLEEFAIETLGYASRNIPAGGYLILSQYPSRFEREHGFEHETELCSRVLDRAVHSLSAQNRFSDESYKVGGAFAGIKTDVYKPIHWRVLLAQ